VGTPRLNQEKAALRRAVQGVLQGLSVQARKAAGRAACDRLKEQPVWQEAKVILGYAPLARELDLWPALVEGLAEGKTICLPRHVACKDDYEAAAIRELDRDVLAGRFGIREPASHCEAVPLNQLDLVLVPGVAFCPHGRRLGRGNGYYDRLLASINGIKCGVGFDEQIRHAIPVEPHDILLDCILTPTRWLLAGHRAV
jgi:5-formyltetrahydrofolate cyclo-ligase